MTNSKWTPEKKWRRFMTLLEWNGIQNWKVVNDLTLQEQIPLIEDWTRRNLKHCNNAIDAKKKFKDFYWGDVSFSPNDYHLKNQAEYILVGAYNKEKELTHD